MENGETKRRLASLVSGSGLADHLTSPEPRLATRDELLAVHTGEYLDYLRGQDENPAGGFADEHLHVDLTSDAIRLAGFEPDVRFETADLQAQIRLIESGNAVALLPDLLWTDREPTVRLRELDGAPRRTIFTSTRQAAARQPGVLACRQALAAGLLAGVS